MKVKFKIGDKVRVINYGHKMWMHKDVINHPQWHKDTPILKEEENILWCDVEPSLVGKIGEIREVVQVKRISADGNEESVGQYSINGIPQKVAWYQEDQLELVTKL